MNRIHRIALSLLLLLTPTLAPAQVTIDITGGAVGALPIAVVPFRVENGSPPDENLAAIIRDDLYRSGLFEPLPSENFVSRPARLEDVRFQNWRALGADNLVIGSISPIRDDEYRVSFELLDVYGGQRLVGKRYRVGGGALRSLAHTISDEIFQELIGRPGGFNSRIAYVQVEGSGDAQRFKLVVAEADGRGPQVILTSREPLLSPAWSPDRERLAYVSFEGRGSQVFVQEVATGERRSVASFEGINGAPAWAPDGRRLALTLSKGGNPDIYLLDLDTGGLSQVTQHWGIDTEPAWMPGGRQIVFTSDRGGRPQIYQVPTGGGQVKRLTFDGDYNANPDLSPNGRLLAMVHRAQQGGFRIAVMDLENNVTRVLTDGPLDESPSFSPNGAMIVYTRSSGERNVLATVSIHGRASEPLARYSAEVREPAWSPL